MTKPLTAKQGELASLGMKGGKHPFYAAWVNMKTRCDNPNSTQWQWYGARGISYDQRWRTFKNFHIDMFSQWREGLELDRERVNEDYGPNNCRWVTHQEQCDNRRPRSLA